MTVALLHIDLDRHPRNFLVRHPRESGDPGCKPFLMEGHLRFRGDDDLRALDTGSISQVK